MGDEYHDIIFATIHTAHALQHNVIGVNHRHVKAKEFIHGVMRHGGGRAKAKEGNPFGLREKIDRAIY
ncbi:Uncharacterised protein [Klebsiella pneumoniae]|nr:Uncharacterised protein [Klebsiella pneumoniae]